MRFEGFWALGDRIWFCWRDNSTALVCECLEAGPLSDGCLAEMESGLTETIAEGPSEETYSKRTLHRNVARP